MWVGVVLYKLPTGTVQNEVVYSAVVATTSNEAAVAAEKQAEAGRKSNTGYSYRTVVGEITKMVKPPESNVTLVDFTS